MFIANAVVCCVCVQPFCEVELARCDLGRALTSRVRGSIQGEDAGKYCIPAYLCLTRFARALWAREMTSGDIECNKTHVENASPESHSIIRQRPCDENMVGRQIAPDSDASSTSTTRENTTDKKWEKMFEV